MKVKLGAVRGGEIFGFDIHPDCCGTHGIVVGGTGSGKTSMVRSWVLSMAATFSPEQVNFVLIDFREPGLLNSLQDLPHVVGTIGCLDYDIDRNLIALKSEMARREELLKLANKNDIESYLGAHYAGVSAAKEPLPFLYIVVDELQMFKIWASGATGNSWISLLDEVYTAGRALGMHVISGNQTPAPFTIAMRNNAKFRWCLRTNVASDSKDILGSDIAFGLKTKGRGFISVGKDISEIQPMYADGAVYSSDELNKYPEYEMALVSITGERKRLQRKKGDRSTELEMMVKYICDFTEKNNVKIPSKIWPDQLPETLMLDDLPTPEENTFSAVVGLIDDPYMQSQYPLEIGLEETGCFLVYGATQTGKTTFLQSFAKSILDNNSPEILEMYIVESASGDFDGFEAYPQVQKIVNSFSADTVIAKISNILEKRTRQRKDETARKILLVIDNLNNLIANYKAQIINIVQNGPGQGIYLVASATQATGPQSTYAVDCLLKTGYCLWISANPHNYPGPLHCKAVSSAPPSKIPGRGLANIGRVVSYPTALIAPKGETAKLPEIVRKHAVARWGEVHRDETKSSAPLEEGAVCLGYTLDCDKEIIHNFRRSASLLVIGDDYEKRQAVLKAVVKQLGETENQAAFLGVDLDENVWSNMSGITFLHSGTQLDLFLEQMRDKLAERIAEKKNNPEAKFPPYIFIFGSIHDSFKACSDVSLNRIDKNLLLNALTFSVFFIAGCSYKDFDALYDKEQVLIAQAGENSTEVIPITRAAVSKCLLLDANNTINPFFHKRYVFDGDGTYYLAGDKAEAIRPVTMEGGTN